MAKAGRPRKHDDGASNPSVKGTRSGKAITFRLSPSLLDALEKFIEAQVVPPAKVAVFEAALVAFLTAQGHPPKP